MNTQEWESRTVLILQRTSVLDVLVNNIAEFTERYGSKPDIAFVHPSCRTALTVEIIKSFGGDASPELAVAEPFWLSTVPVLYNSKVCGTDYLVLKNANTGKELRI